MASRDVTVAFHADIHDLEAALTRAGIVADESGSKIGQKFDQGTSKAASGVERLKKSADSLELPFTSALDAIGQKLDQATTHADKFGSMMADLSKAVLIAGAAGFVAAAGEALKMGESFQQATTSIQNSAGISAAAAKKIGNAFLDTAGKSTFSGQAMATAYGAVAGRLGQMEHQALSTGQATLFMKSAADLAEASQTSLGTATSALAKIMGPFHLTVAQAAGAANILYNTSRVTQIPLDQLAQSADRLKGRLGVLSPSLADMGALMVKLNSFGVSGSRAMMQVNTAFQTLVGSSKPVHEMLSALGVDVFNSRGQFVGLGSVISQLQPKFAQMTQQQQLYVSQTLFGKQAGQEMQSIIQAGAASYDKATAAVQKHNAVQTAAEAQSHTLHGDIETMISAVQDLGDKFGLFLIPKLTAVVGAIANVIDWFEKHKAAAVQLAIVIGSQLAGAIGIFVGEKVVMFVGGLKSMVSAVTTGAASIATKFGLIGSSSTTMAGEVEAADTAVTTSTEATAAAVDTALSSTGVGAVLVALGLAAGELMTHWQTVMNAMKSAVNSMVEAAEAALNGLISALNSAISLFNSTIGQLTGQLGQLNSVGTGGVFGASGGSGGMFNTASGLAPYQAPGINTATGKGFVNQGGIAIPSSGSNAQRIAGALAAQGFSNVAIAGILGNFAQENGGQTLSGISTSAGPGGIGIAQWIGGRATAEQSYAAIHQESSTSLAAQIGFLVQELRTNYHSTFNAIQGAKSPTQAADLFEKMFEGAGTPNMPVREAQANAAYQWLTGGGGKAAATSGKGISSIQSLLNKANGTSAAAKAIKTLLYTNPLGGDQYSIERTDQGKDYGDITGAIKAIGAGQIVLAQTLSGFGQTVVEKLTQGPNAGQEVYYGFETGATGVGLRAGQSVRAGQTIGMGRGTGGVEFGFWNPATGRSEGSPYFNGSNATPPGTAFAKWMEQLAKGNTYLTTKGGVTSGGGTSYGYTLEQALQTFTQALTKQADTLIASYQALQQSATMRTLSKALGFSTAGKTALRIHGVIEGLNTKQIENNIAAGNNPTQIDKKITPILEKTASHSAAMQKITQLIASLEATGQTGLAKALAAQVGATFATLAQELYAQQVLKDAESIQLQATQEKDRTTLESDTAAKQLQVVKDGNQKIIDQMTAAATQIKDATQSITDSFSAMATSVTDSTALMADASSNVVQSISDNTQVQVDILGERGLYGLNLVAQKEQVQLDQAKAFYDQQIGLAQQNLDTVKATWDATVSAAQATADQVQITQDALLSQQQQATDTVQIAADVKLAAAQAHVDSVTLGQDVSVQVAQAAVDLSATAPKAQQDIANAALKKAEANAALLEANANSQMATAQSSANALIASAQNALALAQGNAAAAEAQAQQALAQAQGQAATATAQAQQALQGIQNQANQTEATLTGEVNITQAEASTQYAGSGLVVNMYGINPADAAANASELGWVLRTQVPA